MAYWENGLYHIDKTNRLGMPLPTKPTWMSDKDWSVANRGDEYRPMTEGWSAQDYLRPKEWQAFSTADDSQIGGGVWPKGSTYSTFQPSISRGEFQQNLSRAWGEAPLTTQDIGGQLTATKTLDPTGVSGYGKWGYETGNTSPLSYNWILPEDALNFRFAQSNAPLSDVQRSASFDVGGAYSQARVEASPTRFTSGAFKIPQRESTSVPGTTYPVTGGVTDYTTGEMYTPQMGGASQAYQRFRGYSPNLGAYTPFRGAVKSSEQIFKGSLKQSEREAQWAEEFYIDKLGSKEAYEKWLKEGNK